MVAYSPGDVIVDVLTISSQRGTLDLAKSFVSASVFESIFTPGIIAYLYVLDTNDQLGNLKLVGDETIQFEFKAPGGEPAIYKFAMYKLEATESSSGAQKSKQYKISCVSEEALNAKTNYVQKHYKQTISEMVKDVHENYMKSQKPLDIEETKGEQKILISNYNPYKAIDMMRRRAVSNENKSSSYLFFETRNGSEQTFKFTTLEKLFQGNPVKTYQQSDTVSQDFRSTTDTNILGYKVPQQMSTTDRIAIGGKRRVAQFNFRTWDYQFEDAQPDPKSFKYGGDGSYDSSEFKQKYYDAPKIPPTNIIPTDASSGDRPNTGIPQSTADQQAYLATLMQNALTIKVIGDSKLKAGDVIAANIPVKESSTGNKQNDPLLSGNFLISRIHHEILSASEQPRYCCNIELIKGLLNEGV